MAGSYNQSRFLPRTSELAWDPEEGASCLSVHPAQTPQSSSSC